MPFINLQKTYAIISKIKIDKNIEKRQYFNLYTLNYS
jgi:hypothetical protein